MTDRDPTEINFEASRKEEFIRHAQDIARHVENSEAHYFREMSRFTLHEFEPPLHMPDAIQRYREVMVPIQSIDVYCDATDYDVRWALEIALGADGGKFKKIFMIYYDESNQGGGYFIQEDGKEPERISSTEINKILVDVSLSHTERIRREGVDLGTRFDSSDNTQAKYLRETLAARPNVIHERQRFFDLAEPLGSEGLAIEFSMRKRGGELIGAGLLIDEVSLDGPVEKHLNYSIGFTQVAPANSGGSVYEFEIDSTRMIDIGDGSLQPNDGIDNVTVLEHGLVVLNGVKHVYGIQQPDQPVNPFTIDD